MATEQAIENCKKPGAVRILGDIICNFTVPPTTEKFVAKDKFKVDTSRGAKVKISYLNDLFAEWFLNKIEDPFAGSTISGRELNENSVDSFILQELGGNEKAEITLTELFAAMEAQPNDKSGNLLNNGWANIFYIKDVNDTLRVVSVGWGDDGWRVSADSVENPRRWYADYRAFSRSSLVSQAA